MAKVNEEKIKKTKTKKVEKNINLEEKKQNEKKETKSFIYFIFVISLILSFFNFYGIYKNEYFKDIFNLIYKNEEVKETEESIEKIESETTEDLILEENFSETGAEIDLEFAEDEMDEDFIEDENADKDISYKIYIGLTNENSKIQEISAEEAEQVIRNACIKRGVAYTIYTTKGGYLDEDKYIHNEKNFVLEMDHISEDTLYSIMNELHKKLRTGQIMVVKAYVEAFYYLPNN